MNEINENNDPFEDVFRDRFADFESEPDTQLWQKIEPKLPVDSIRKFPYWQTSAVVILLLLAGLWTYREKDSDDIIIKSDDSQTEKIVKSEGNQIKEKMSSDYRLTEPNPTQTTDSKGLIGNYLEKNTAKQLEGKTDIAKLSNERSVSTRNMRGTTAAETVFPTNRIA